MSASRSFALVLTAALTVTPRVHAEPAAGHGKNAKQAAATEPTPVPLAPPAPAASNDDPQRTAHAKALFEKAANAYAAGHYYDAIEEFLEVDRFYPNDQLPYNIAKAYDNLGSRPGALRYYREYLRRSPDAPDHEAVVARVRELELGLAERGLQQVTVFSDPPDATVLLDDRPVGLTPWTGETWPGHHRVAVQKDGYLEHEVVMDLDPLKAEEVNLELAPAPAAAPPPPAPPPNTDKPWPLTRRMSVLTWATLATGTAALGTSIAVQASSGAKDARITPAAGFFAGLGTAAAVVGGVMLYFDLSDQAGDERHAAVNAGPERVMATYQTSF
ncbi:MAG TPA: PEGA domain-containing protein [Polyangiaceae bacterium]|nr:PEGA domain-containing protein [Polyangiaceae bacterium]